MTEDWKTRVGTLRSNYGAEIERYCYVHLTNTDSARDAAQEIFCKLLSQGDDSIHEERAWLYMTARNHCLNIIRQSSRRTKAMIGHSQMHTKKPPRASILSGIVHKEIRQRLFDIVHNLPLNLREPLFLRYLAGFGRSEIVRILDLSEHTVKARLHNALKQLRKHTSLRMT